MGTISNEFQVHSKINQGTNKKSKIVPIYCTQVSNVPASYLEMYISWFYYLCLFPHKPTRKNNSVALDENRIQQTVSILLLLCNEVYAFQQIRSASQMDIFKQPLEILSVIMAIGESVLTSLLIQRFWFNKKILLGFITKVSTDIHKLEILHQKRKATISGLILLVSILLIFYRFGKELITFGSSGLANGDLDLKDDEKSNAITEAMSHLNNMTWSTTTIAVISRIGGCVSQLQITFAKTFIFVIALVSYEMVCKYKSLAKSSSDNSHNNGQFYNCNEAAFVTYAYEMKSFFEILNGFSSGLFLCWFSLNFPWMSYRLVEIFPREGLKGYYEVLIYNFFNIGLNGVVVVLCAEVRRQAEEYQRIVEGDVLLDDPNLTWGKSIISHVNYALKNVGVHGGHFFIFSYGFLGSALGLIVAYSFLVLQFHLASPNSAT